MRRNIKWISIPIAVLAAGILFSACGGGGDSTSGGSETSGSSGVGSGSDPDHAYLGNVPRTGMAG